MPLGNWEGKLHLKAEPEDLPILRTTTSRGMEGLLCDEAMPCG